jgi:serine/threonine protein kinase
MVQGTAEYISPEVAAGLGAASFASDAWALGCVLYQASPAPLCPLPRPVRIPVPPA